MSGGGNPQGAAGGALRVVLGDQLSPGLSALAGSTRA